MARENHYDRDDLIRCGKGELFGCGNAQLPLPPLLMVDRITSITGNGGDFDNGEILAEFDIEPSLWFFKCHFLDDPVMPGCLGLDGMWQLLGFFLAWQGGLGRGRALGVGKVKYSGQVSPSTKMVKYHLHIKRFTKKRLPMGIADATLAADNQTIYDATDLKVGLFNTDLEV